MSVTNSSDKDAAVLAAFGPPPAVRAMSTGVLSHRVAAAGLCSDAGDDQCYPPIRAQRRRELADYARRHCQGCEVFAECRELALRYEAKAGSSHGVWGGTAPWQRQAMIRARSAGQEVRRAS